MPKHLRRSNANVLSMVGAALGDESYIVKLIDGFVTPNLSKRGRYANRAQSYESIMAEHLYELCKYHGTGRPQVPDHVDVWIVGAKGWQRDLPELFRSFADRPPHNSYRVVIAGYSLGSLFGKYLPSWSAWTYQAGMTRKQRHKSHTRYRQAATPLLRLMKRYHDRVHGQPPSPILTHLGVPFEYFGDRRD